MAAPRGMLGHWIRIKDGRIENYQCVVPTTWNGSPRDAQGNPTGEQQRIAEYWAIDEQKLNSLPDDQLAQLHREGILGACYAHIISLLNWSRVLNRAMRQQNPQSPPEPQGGSEGPHLQI